MNPEEIQNETTRMRKSMVTFSLTLIITLIIFSILMKSMLN